jgi:DNA polymerase III gamma/tau subunit
MNDYELLDKYNPNTWDELVGQDHIVSYFKKIIKEPLKYPHNYILNGGYGTGKTSTANIFYNELKKVKNTFKYDFDASVIGNKEDMKNIKSVIDNIFIFSQDFRVIIFDEIQEASKSSQSLFLKTLENKNSDYLKDKNLYFFFLTTDSSRLIPTIISRCIELNFLFISSDDVRKRINQITEIEQIFIDERSVNLIIEKCEGHLRDAIKLLNVYMIMKDEFKNIICNTQKIIYEYMFTDNKTINDIKIFPVNILIKDLNKLFTKIINRNIDESFLNIIQLFELYMKYKNYVTTIDDFISVMNILKKFISMKGQTFK